MIIEIEVPNDNTCDGCIANNPPVKDGTWKPGRCRLFEVNLVSMKKANEQWVSIPCGACKDARPIY
jgi:hypothetical protein